MPQHKKRLYLLWIGSSTAIAGIVWLTSLKRDQEPASVDRIEQQQLSAKAVHSFDPIPAPAVPQAVERSTAPIAAAKAGQPPPMEQQLDAAQQAIDRHQVELEGQLQTPLPQVTIGNQGQDLPVAIYNADAMRDARIRARLKQASAVEHALPKKAKGN